jgi:hypothetical protein
MRNRKSRTGRSCKEPKIIDKEYGIIHFDSPDKRGIDVAIVSKKEISTH